MHISIFVHLSISYGDWNLNFQIMYTFYLIFHRKILDTCEKSLYILHANGLKVTNLDLLLTKIDHNLPGLRYLSLLGNVACPNQLSDSNKDEDDYQRYR